MKTAPCDRVPFRFGRIPQGGLVWCYLEGDVVVAGALEPEFPAGADAGLELSVVLAPVSLFAVSPVLALPSPDEAFVAGFLPLE